ncbi:MAG: membrane protein insertase YidC [Desulfatiglans sp.]|jgi:YidC/Oxa1 family membrane protein insertase|nr:membrane protein insertase YidC [Thermodesulfobacteriota bacterium]MEE4352905.1 membrane protein insertase YidC [Desulfatiglans sp.]
MEKRTILAFILSFLVLILWSYFFGPTKEQGSKKEVPTERGTPPAATEGEPIHKPTHPPVYSTSEDKAGTPVYNIEKKEIEVETPLFKAILTNVGPTIKSFRLKAYHKTTDPDSPPIELVNLKNDRGGVITAGFDRSDAAQMDKKVYEVDSPSLQLGPGASPKKLTFYSTDSDGVSIRQTFQFYSDQYRIDFTIEVVNKSERPMEGTFTTVLKALPPEEKGSYYSFVGLALLVDDELEEVKIKKTSDEKDFEGVIDWIAYEDDFFISAVVPEKEKGKSFHGRLLSSGFLKGTHMSAPVSLNPYEKASSKYALYLGPRDLGILKDFGSKLDRAVDFGWTDIIAKPLLYLLRFFNGYINNYGVSIILLTILIKILFWPLTHKSYKSMKEMQKLQPRMAKIREKYKGNKEQINKEMMALYKTYKVNPMGGCLPMIIQLPVFFALFRLLGSAIELRHAPFMLWINDLSAPDRLFNFSFSIPFMKEPYGIPVLTLLMGASMFVQQKMTPTPGDPTQAKIMMFLPIIFTFMFINFPSGLVLYWLVNNILSIGQQYRIHKGPA